MKKIHLLLLLLLAACTDKKEQPIWPDEKMARIMADLGTAEAAANGLNGYSRDSLAQLYYKQVFDMHGVTLADYEKNLDLLSNDMPRLSAVMDSAQAILKRKIPPGGASKLNVPQ